MPPFELPPGYEPKITFDTGNALGYNGDRNEDYAAIAGIDQHTQIVNMDHQKPIHDNKCRHKTLIPDPEDTIGDAVYHGCANVKCGVGFYIK